MGVFGQLGLLLWKNIQLRIRQPVILLLEIVWPILIFLVVTLVRQGTPPQHEKTCYYPPRAMPSAGFDFLKDFICNINNDCHDNHKKASSVGNPSMAEFLKSVEPFYTNANETSAALRELPKVKGVLDKMKEGFENPEYRGLLDIRLVIGDIFYDQEKVIKYLSDDMGVLSRDVAQALMNSSLNITKMYDLLGRVDLKSLVCNATELSEYIVFSKDVNVDVVSRSLCNINESLIPHFTDTLQRQIDVSKILRLAAHVEDILGYYDESMALEDIATMFDVFHKTKSFSKFFDQFPAFKNTSKLIMRLADFLRNSNDTNMAMLGFLGQVLDPFISEAAGDISAFRVIFDMVEWFNTATSNIRVADITLGDLLRNKSGFVETVTTMLNITADALEASTQFNLDQQQMGNFIQRASQGSDMHSLMCDDPGFVAIFKTSDDKNRTKLQQLQDELCDVNATVLFEQLNEMLDMERLVTLMQVKQKAEVKEQIASWNWTALAGNLGDIMVSFQSLTSYFEPLLDDAGFSFQRIWTALGKSTTSLLQGNFNTNKTLAEELKEIQGPFEYGLSLLQVQLRNLAMWDDIKTFLGNCQLFLDITESIVHQTQNMTTDLQKFLVENEDFQQWLELLNQTDPTTAETILSRLLNISNLMELPNNPEKLENMFCNATWLNEWFGINSKTFDTSFMLKLFCNRNVTRVVHTLQALLDISGLEDKFATEIEKAVQRASDNSTYDVQDLGTLYHRLIQIMEKMTTLSPVLSTHGLEDILPNNFNTTWGEKLKSYLLNEYLLNSFSNLGQSLQNSELWSSIDKAVAGIYRTLILANQDMQQVTDNSSVIYRLSRYTLLYGPDLLEGMANILGDKDKIKQVMALLEDLDRLCDKTTLAELLQVSDNVPLAEMQQYACSLNQTQLLSDIDKTTNMEPIQNIINVIVSRSSPNIDWRDFFKQGKEFVIQTMEGRYPEQIDHSWEFVMQINGSRYSHALDRLWKALEKNDLMSGDNALSLAEMATGLDETLGNTTFWKTFRYYAFSMNEFMKLTKDNMNSMQGNGIKMEDLLKNGTRLRQMLEMQDKMTPYLMAALENAIMNPTKMMKMIRTTNFGESNFCNGLSVKDFMEFPEDVDVRSFDEMLCDMNITLLEELMQQPALAPYQAAMDRFFVKDINNIPTNVSLNWTELIQNMVEPAPFYSQSWPDYMKGLNMSLPTDMKLFNLTFLETTSREMLSRMSQVNMAQALRNYQDLEGILGSDNATKDMFAYLNRFFIVENAYLEFANIHLKKFNSTAEVKLMDYININTPEASKLMGMKDNSGIMFEVLMNGFVQALTDPSKMFSLMKYWTLDSTMCTNLTVFETVFPKPINSSIDMAEVQGTICNTSHVDYAKVAMELLSNMKGFDKYMNTIQRVFEPYEINNISLNITSLAANNELYVELITAIGANPPKFTLGMPSDWLDFQNLNQTLNKYVEKLDWNQILQTFNANSSQLLGMLGSELLTTLDNLTITLGFDDWMSQSNAVIELMIATLRNIAGKNVTIDVLLQDQPETLRLVKLSMKMPIIYETALNTSMNSPDKWAKVTSGNLTTLCNSKPEDIFDISPSSLEEVTTIHREFCATDFDALTMEFMTYTVQTMSNDTRPFSWSRYMRNQAELSNLYMLLFSQDTVWDVNITQLTQYDWQKLFVQQKTPNLDESVSQAIEQASPLFDMFLKDPNMTRGLYQANAIMELLIADLEPIVEKNLTIQSFLKGKPETRKLLKFVEKLPVVLEVLLSTLTMSPDKQIVFSDPARLCMEPIDSVFVLMPDIQIEARQLQKDACDINVTALVTELSGDSDKYRKIFESGTGSFNLTAYVNNNMKLNTIMTQLGSKQFQWDIDLTRFTRTDWLAMLERIGSTRGSLASVEKSIPAMLASFEQLVQNSSQILQFISQMNAGIEHLINEIEPMVGRNVSLTSILVQQPETMKVIKLLRHSPVVYEVLMYTAARYPDRMAFLGTLNLTTLCQLAVNDTFAIPENLSGQFAEAYAQVCALDLPAIAREANDMQSVWMQNVTSYVNLTTLTLNLMKLGQLYSNLSSTVVIGEDFSWTAQWDWTRVLNNLAQYQYPYSSANLKATMDTFLPQFEQWLGNISMETGTNQMLVQSNAALGAIIKQLQSFQGKNLTIIDLLASHPQSRSLYNLLSQGPVIYEVLVSTMMFKPDRWSRLMTEITNGTQVCLNSPDDFFFIPANLSRQMDEIWTTLCGTNLTALQTELMQPWNSGSFQENENTGNFSAYISNIVTLSELISNMKIQFTSPEMDFRNLINWDWNKVNARIMKYFENASSMSGMSNITLQSLELLLASSNTSDELAASLTNLETTVQILEIVAILQDPALLYKDSPEIQKLLKIGSQSPELMEIFFLSAINHGTFGNVQQLLTLQNMSICNMLENVEAYIVQPPNSTVDINEVQSLFCRLNFSVIAEEANSLVQDLYEPFLQLVRPESSRKTGSSYNVTELYKKFVRTQQLWQQLLSGNLTIRTESFSWLYSDSWKQTGENIMSKVLVMGNNQDNIQNYFKGMEQLSFFFDMTSVNTKLNGANAMMEVLLKKINHFKNRTISNLEELFESSPELQKVISLLETSPELVDALLYSLDSRKMDQLLSSGNFTPTIMEFCNSDKKVTDILSQRPGSTVDLNSFKTEICSINFTQVETETWSEFDVNYIEMQLQNPAPVNWTALYIRSQEFTGLLDLLIKTPPRLNTTDGWTNSTIWLDILTRNMQANYADSQTYSEYIAVLDQLKYLEDDNPTVDIMSSLLQDIIKTLNKKTTVLQQMGGNITLHDLLQDSPQLANLLKITFQESPDVLHILLNAAVEAPDKLFEMFSSEKPLQYLCQKSPKDIAVIFKLPSNMSVTNIHGNICNNSESELSRQTLEQVGLNHFLASLQKYSTTGKWDRKTNWTELLFEIQTWNEKLSLLLQNQSNFRFQDLDLTKLDEKMKNFLIKFDVKQTENIWPLFVASLQGIYGEEVTNVTQMYLRLYQISIAFFNKIASNLRLDGKTLDLQSMFKNTTNLRQLLDVTFRLGPDIASGIMRTSVKLEKVPELVEMLSGDVSQVLCNADNLREYFILPPSLNVTLVSAALCQLNMSELMIELQKEFDLGAFLQELQRAQQDMQPVDVRSLQNDYRKFLQNLLRLSNVSEARFMGISQLSNITMVTETPALWKTLQGVMQSPDDMASFSAGMERLESELEGTDFWKTAKPIIIGAMFYMDVMSKQITSLPISDMTLDDILKNSNLTKDYLRRIYALDPDVIQLLLKSRVDIAKMMSLSRVTKPADVMMWCNETLYVHDKKASDLLCNSNYTAMWQELQRDVNFVIIQQEFAKIAVNSTEMKINWTAYYIRARNYSNELQNYFISFNMTHTTPDFFLADGNFTSWLKRIENAFEFPSLSDRDTRIWIGNYLNDLMKDPATSSFWREILPTANAINTLADVLSNRLDNIRVTLTLKDILQDEPHTRLYLQKLFAGLPDVVNTLLYGQVDTTYLEEVADYTDISQLFCSGALKYPDSPTLNKRAVEDILCRSNYTAIATELQDFINWNAVVSQFTQNYTEKMAMSFNWTEYLLNLAELQTKLDMQLSSPVSLTYLFSYNGNMTFWLKRMELALNHPYGNDIAKIVEESVSSTMRALLQNPDNSTGSLAFLHAFDTVMQVLNSKLRHLTSGEITVESILGNSTQLRQILNTTLSLNQSTIDLLLNSKFTQELVLMIVENNMTKAKFCDRSISDMMSPPPDGSISLTEFQEIICGVDVDKLLEELQKNFDLQKIINTFLNIGNTSADTVPFNSTTYINNLVEFNDLLTKLLTNPPKLDTSMLDIFDVSRWQPLLNSFIKQDVSQQLWTNFENLNLYNNIADLFILNRMVQFMRENLQSLVDGNRTFQAVLWDPTVLSKMYMDLIQNVDRLTHTFERELLANDFEVMPLLEPVVCNITAYPVIAEFLFGFDDTISDFLFGYDNLTDFNKTLCETPTSEWLDRLLMVPRDPNTINTLYHRIKLIGAQNIELSVIFVTPNESKSISDYSEMLAKVIEEEMPWKIGSVKVTSIESPWQRRELLYPADRPVNTDWSSTRKQQNLTRIKIEAFDIYDRILSLDLYRYITKKDILSRLYKDFNVVDIGYSLKTSSAPLTGSYGFNVTWKEFSKNLQNVANLMEKLNTITPVGLQDLKNINSSSWDGLLQGGLNGIVESLSKYLPVVANQLQFIGNPRKYDLVGSTIYTIAYTMKYVNDRFQQAVAFGGKIDVDKLFPDKIRVRQLLSSATSEETAEALMQAKWKPTTTVKLTDQEVFKAYICNLTMFHDAFTFPDGVNYVKVHQELCQAVQNNSLLLWELLKLMDFQSFVQQLNVIAMEGPAQKKNPWEFLSTELKTMSQNIGVLQKAFGADENLFLALMNPTFSYLDTILLAIDVFNSTIECGFTPEVAVDLLKSLPEVNQLLCEMPYLNLTEIYDRLMNGHLHGVWQKMEMLTRTDLNDVCKSPFEVQLELRGVINETIHNLPYDYEETLLCMQQNAYTPIPALQQLDNVLMMLRAMRGWLADVGQIQWKDDLLFYMDLVLDGVIQQKAVMVEFNKVLDNSSNMYEALHNISKVVAESINALATNNLKVDTIAFFNKTSEEIEEILCDPLKLSEVLSVPTGFNATALSEVICSPNMSQIISQIENGISLEKLFLQISQTIPRYGFNMDYLAKVMLDTTRLIESFGGLSKMSSLMNGFKVENLIEFLPELQEFSLENGPETVFDNMAILIDDFRSVSNDAQTQEILDDMQDIANGVRSLHIINRMIPIDVQIKSMLKRPDELRDYLVDVLDISPLVADAILNSSLSFTKLIVLDEKDWKNEICNATNFEQLLILNNDAEVNISQISQQLCSIEDADLLANITDYLIQELNIGNLIKNMVSLDLTSLLKNMNISVGEVGKIVKKLQPFQKNFTRMAKSLKSITNVIYLPTSAGRTDRRRRSPSLSSLGGVVCGNRNAFLLNDDIGLSKGAGNETKVGSVSEKQSRQQKDQSTEEMNSFKSDFCRDIYRDLVSQERGQIIWTYIKPLVLGKIPFTPNTPTTRAIMAEVSKTFQKSEELQEFIGEWMESLKSLQSINTTDDDYRVIKEALKNPLIDDAIHKSLDVNTVDILLGIEGIEQMNNIDVGTINMLGELVYNISDCMETDRVIGYDTEEDMENEARKLHNFNKMLAGVVFLDMAETNGRQRRAVRNDSTVMLPKHVKYKIRMDIDNVPATDRVKDLYWHPERSDSFVSDMRYLRGFLVIQDLLERAVIHRHTGKTGDDLPYVELQQFPYPCHKKDNFQQIISLYFFPIIMTLAWLVFIAVAIRNLVIDKEKRIEVTLKAMGLRGSVNWFAWFLNVFLAMLLMSFIVVLFLRFGQLMPYSNPVILFLYMAAFSLATVMYCYLISAFFTRAVLAALAGILIYLICYLPYVILVTMETEMEFWHKILVCLSWTSAFSYGSQMISYAELKGEGVHWSENNDIASTQDKNLDFPWTCYMMLIDAGIYAILAWYISNVFPGKYGIAQPWYFPLSPTYWGCRNRKSSKGKKLKFAQPSKGSTPGGATGAAVKSLSIRSLEQSSKMPVSDVQHGSISNTSPIISPTEFMLGYGEDDPSELPIGVSLHNLSKEFKKEKRVALDKLNLNVYQGQVTALLGHNGAGKTTAINLLTGVLPPSSGEAYVDGRSILQDINNIRDGLGLCPQEDVLFDLLTTREHLDFYITLKGKLSKKEKKKDINRMLDMTGLEMCQNVQARHLSGGQRRRLSVAIAFAGKSRTIILDEPTSGVDPAARRSIWDIILNNREGRTIMLTTHYLEEADILGDRILLLHQGKLLVRGSPLYLKSQFGSGYHLTIAKDMNVQNKAGREEAATNICRSSNVEMFIKKHLPDARLVEEIGTEMKFVLPTDRQQIVLFQGLFEDLQNNMADLHISSYGVSPSTMEEVFLKLTRAADKGEDLSPERIKTVTLHTEPDIDKDSGIADGASTNRESVTISLSDSDDRGRRKSGCSLKMQQFASLFSKRFYHHLRDIWSFLSFILLPCLFIILAMGCSLIKPSTDNMPSLPLTPALYGPNTEMFFKLETQHEVNDALIQTLMHQPGVGTTCMGDYRSSCNDWSNNFTYPDTEPIKNPPDCSCNTSMLVCPAGAGGNPQPYMRTPAGNILRNITASQFDIPEYLLRTYRENIMKRFGGWSFDVEDDQSKATVWYDNKGWHAAPAFYSSLNNMILRSNLDKNQNPEEYGITAYNHPLSLTKEQLGKITLVHSIADAGLALTILCAMCFVPAAFAVYIIRERTHQEKRLQHICGVGIFLYWSCTLLWDFATYILTVGLATAITAAFQISIYNARYNLAAFVVALLLYGWAAIPLVYLIVRKFRDPSTGYLTIFIVYLLLGINTVACVFLLSLFTNVESLVAAHDILQYVFLIFPPFCLGDSMIRLTENQFMADIYARFGIDKYQNPFSFEMIAWNLIAMGIQGLVFFILLLIVESRPCSSSGSKRNADDALRRKGELGYYKEDNDVSLERQRVTSGGARKDLLVVRALKKVFGRGSCRPNTVVAVDRITFGVPRGECLGLLGENGAGKTTTFNMITNEKVPTSGYVMFKNKVITGCSANMKNNIGYCPQFDALDPNLTVEEMLLFYGRLKGVLDEDKEVTESLQKFELEDYATKTIRTLSGGTKRKVSAAISLLGQPDIVLMDEPTAGLDPATQRLVWNNILDVVKKGRSVLLTSHSMAECDALCSRMAIMANGHFICLGSGQHLKNKYGSGYTVKLKVTGKSENLNRVRNYMMSTFHGAVLKNHNLNMLEFEIPRDTAPLSDIFGAIEDRKKHLHIEDYSVSQTTLDQVFINFTKQQSDCNMGMDDDDDDSILFSAPYSGENVYVHPPTASEMRHDLKQMASPKRDRPTEDDRMRESLKKLSTPDKRDVTDNETTTAAAAGTVVHVHSRQSEDHPKSVLAEDHPVKNEEDEKPSKEVESESDGENDSDLGENITIVNVGEDFESDDVTESGGHVRGQSELSDYVSCIQVGDLTEGDIIVTSVPAAGQPVSPKHKKPAEPISSETPVNKETSTATTSLPEVDRRSLASINSNGSDCAAESAEGDPTFYYGYDNNAYESGPEKVNLKEESSRL